MRTPCIGIALSLWIAVSALAQTTVSLQADLDNTLYQSATGDLSNGLGAHLFVGRTAQSDEQSRRRALVRFDLSSIPESAIVTDVTLTLYCSRANQSGPTTVTAHRVLADWGEGSSDAPGQEGAGAASTTGDATWIHAFFDTVPWGTQGGDFDPVPTASAVVGGEGLYSWSSTQLLLDVQSWVDGVQPNHGWILVGDETGASTAKRLDSRQESAVERRPVLEITYVASAEPGACCLPGGCEQLTPSECAALGGQFIGSGVACTPDPCTGGAIVTVTSTSDNTMYESATGSISNGSGIGVFAGTNDSLQARRGLVRFDLSSEVPTGAIVTSASLSMYVSFTQAQGANTTALHRALADWGEGASDANGNETSGAPAEPGDATWLHRFYDGVFWSSAGGDFESAPSATTIVGTTTGFVTWEGGDLVADIQAWVDDPASNLGWVIVGDERGSRTQRRFDSREAATPSQRPILTIEYVIAATGACCLPGGSCTETTEADCAAMNGTWRGDGVACADVTCPLVLEPFVDALPIPGVLEPVAGAPGGEATYEVSITQFQQQLHRDLPPTTVWGYAGSYPGPTIEARRDMPVTVTWRNDLRDDAGVLLTEHHLPVDLCLHGPNMLGPTARLVTHLHGGVVPFAFDGYPEFTILPGEETTYVYPNIQAAGTLWYHDHALGITRLNVYMGLAGFFLLRDDVEDALNIPRGEFEIPLAIQDRAFEPDGSLSYPAAWQDHFFGDTVLVNGKVWPFLEVKRGKYRFRMLNGSGSRVYTLALSDGATFWQIGTDVGLLESPVALDSLTIAPGERADVVIDFESYEPGTELLLVNSASAPFPGTPGQNVIPDVMKFVVLAETGDTDALPGALAPVVPIPEEEAIIDRPFVLDRFSDDCTDTKWLINGLLWDDVTETVRLDTTEIWSWINATGVMHPMHMHLVRFQVLDRQDFAIVDGEIVPTGPRVPPPPNERGWKDTVQVQPGQIARVIARFEAFEGLFSYHCHILEHEDHEMMRQFRTVPVADLTLDGNVDGADLAVLLGNWAGPGGDLDGNGVTDGADLAILLGQWTG